MLRMVNITVKQGICGFVQKLIFFGGETDQ